jgi:hypothetical protein
MRRASEPAGTLRAVIERALPRRALPVERALLVNAIAERVETWKSLDPQIKPHAEKIRALAAVADDLEKALETAGRKLRELGAEVDIERAKAQNAALGIHGPGQPLAGKSPTLDLYLIPWRAIDRVRWWNRVYRRGKGRAPAFSAALSETLREVCCELAGLSSYEFADLLQALSGQHGLPKLCVDTLKKRRHRARKRAGTK